MFTDHILDAKLGIGLVVAWASSVAANHPFDDAILQYGAFGLLALSVFWIFKSVIPSFLDRFFESQKSHISHLMAFNDKLDTRLEKLSCIIEKHTEMEKKSSETGEILVRRVSELIERHNGR